MHHVKHEARSRAQQGYRNIFGHSPSDLRSPYGRRRRILEANGAYEQGHTLPNAWDTEAKVRRTINDLRQWKLERRRLRGRGKRLETFKVFAKDIWKQLKFLLGAWINVLLAFVPAGFAVNYTLGQSATTFAINFVAVVPLTVVAGQCLEPIRTRWQAVATFLYITLFNFVQLISGIFLLKNNQVLVLQTTLIGGILCNILLVFGVSILAGGSTRISQNYNLMAAHTSANLLSLASTSLLIPTAAALLQETSTQDLYKQSRGASVMLVVVYIAYLFFQYKTHHVLMHERSARGLKYRPDSKENQSTKSQVSLPMTAQPVDSRMSQGQATTSDGNGLLPSVDEGEEDEEEEEPSLLFVGVATILLLISTVLTGFCTKFLVDSTTALSQNAGLSPNFIGLVLLPLLNVDLAPISHAFDDEMDETIEYTIGKSLQTALLVTPLFVFISWGMNVPQMTLNFSGFEIVSLFASILLLNYLIVDGKSSWIQGVLLMADWGLIAIAAFYAKK